MVAGVVIYAIPADPQKQQALVQTASDTFVWGATYCQREPDACRQAGDFFVAAMQKARFGVAFAEQVANKWPRHHADGPALLVNVQNPSGKSNHTLTIDDILAASPDQPEPPASPAPTAANTIADPSVDG